MWGGDLPENAPFAKRENIFFGFLRGGAFFGYGDVRGTVRWVRGTVRLGTFFFIWEGVRVRCVGFNNSFKAFLGQKNQHGFRESDESVCVCGRSEKTKNFNPQQGASGHQAAG